MYGSCIMYVVIFLYDFRRFLFHPTIKMFLVWRLFISSSQIYWLIIMLVKSGMFQVSRKKLLKVFTSEKIKESWSLRQLVLIASLNYSYTIQQDGNSSQFASHTRDKRKASTSQLACKCKKTTIRESSVPRNTQPASLMYWSYNPSHAYIRPSLFNFPQQIAININIFVLKSPLFNFRTLNFQSYPDVLNSFLDCALGCKLGHFISKQKACCASKFCSYL